MPINRKKTFSDSYRSNDDFVDAESSNVDSAGTRATRPATRQVPEFPPSTTTRPEPPHARPINRNHTRRGVDTVSGGRTGHDDRRFSATSKMGASGLVAPEIQYHTPHHQPSHTTALLRPPQPHAQHDQLSPRSQRQPPPVVTPVPIPRTPSLSNQPPAERPLQPPQSADRNIDKVVLGDLCFRTWYPSYYGKEILDLHNNHSGKAGGGSKDESGRKDQHPVLGMLYVCPHCFKYSKELVAWGGHVRVCSRKDAIPGRKIYVHPRGTRKVQVAQPQSAGGSGKRKRDSGLKYFEETVTDQGEWSIWEVDGEDERVSSP